MLHMPDLVTSVVAAPPAPSCQHNTLHWPLATLHKHRNEQIRDPGPDIPAPWSPLTTHGGDIYTMAMAALRLGAQRAAKSAVALHDPVPIL